MKEIVNLVSDEEEELPSGPSAGLDTIHSVSALATSRNTCSPSPTQTQREGSTPVIKVSATTNFSTCELLKAPSGSSARSQSFPSPSMSSQSEMTIERDLNHHAVKTQTLDSPPRVRTQQEMLRILTGSILLSKTRKKDGTTSDTPHEPFNPTEHPILTETKQLSPPQTSGYDSSSFFHRRRCTAGTFKFCNDEEDWNIRLCSLVPFERSLQQNLPMTDKPKSELNKTRRKVTPGKSLIKRSPTPKSLDKLEALVSPNHTEDDENIPKATDRLCNEVELFTDLYKATIKLEFFVDFPKPIKGKYPTTPVPFIPIILIKRVILKKEEKSFWDALKSQKKENRRQVFVRSTANLVSLVKAMKCWPHPESSDSDRQGL